MGEKIIKLPYSQQYHIFDLADFLNCLSFATQTLRDLFSSHILACKFTRLKINKYECVTHEGSTISIAVWTICFTKTNILHQVHSTKSHNLIQISWGFFCIVSMSFPPVSIDIKQTYLKGARYTFPQFLSDESCSKVALKQRNQNGFFSVKLNRGPVSDKGGLL